MSEVEISQVKLIKKIEYLEKNDKKCSINCQFAIKEGGEYNCTLFDVVIDTGDDHEDGLYGKNDRGYGFVRCDECIKSEIKEKEDGK